MHLSNIESNIALKRLRGIYLLFIYLFICIIVYVNTPRPRFTYATGHWIMFEKKVSPTENGTIVVENKENGDAKININE